MPLSFTLRQLEYFVAVGDAGSIAAASDRVNVSSPSISAAISQLEAEFGVQLFVRQHAQGLFLTPGGRRIFNEAKHLLDGAASLSDLAGEIVEKARGPISVGYFITLAPLISASIRRTFEGEFPDANVTQRAAHQVDLLQMLGRAEIDIAITYDLEIPKGIAFDGLIELQPYVMVHAKHPMAKRASVSLEELEDEPMVLLDLPQSREYFLSMFHSRNLRPNIVERTSDLAVTRSLVANRFGYGLINIRTKTNAAPDGEKLAFLKLEGDHRPMVLGFARKRSENTSRIVAAFQEHVRARIATGALPGMASPD